MIKFLLLDKNLLFQNSVNFIILRYALNKIKKHSKDNILIWMAKFNNKTSNSLFLIWLKNSFFLHFFPIFYARLRYLFNLIIHWFLFDFSCFFVCFIYCYIFWILHWFFHYSPFFVYFFITFVYYSLLCLFFVVFVANSLMFLVSLVAKFFNYFLLFSFMFFISLFTIFV
jgi:hypothetical protein